MSVVYLEIDDAEVINDKKDVKLQFLKYSFATFSFENEMSDMVKKQWYKYRAEHSEKQKKEMFENYLSDFCYIKKEIFSTSDRNCCFKYLIVDCDELEQEAVVYEWKIV